jgi:exodeoxyribonuclease VII small subunit
MPRRKTEPGTPSPGDDASFDETLASLESIVEAMEHDQLGLEELVHHFEKGNALLDRCESIIKAARQRIELVTLRNQEEIGLDARGAADQAHELSPPGSDPEDSDNDDDIRLF